MPLAFAFVPDGKRAQSEREGTVKLNSRTARCLVAKELNRARIAYECISIHHESGECARSLRGWFREWYIHDAIVSAQPGFFMISV